MNGYNKLGETKMEMLPQGNITTIQMPSHMACTSVTAESTCIVNTKSVWWILMNPTRAHIVSFFDGEGNLINELVGRYTISKADALLDQATVITIKHENSWQGGISVSRDGDMWNVSVLPIAVSKWKGLTNYVHVNLFNSIKHSYRVDATDKEVTDTTTVFINLYIKEQPYHGSS